MGKTHARSLRSVFNSEIGLYYSGRILSLPGLGSTTLFASFRELVRRPTSAASRRARNSNTVLYFKSMEVRHLGYGYKN